MRLGHGEYTLVFKALSDETRLRVLLMLTGGELCACQILSTSRSRNRHSPTT